MTADAVRERFIGTIKDLLGLFGAQYEREVEDRFPFVKMSADIRITLSSVSNR